MPYLAILRPFNLIFVSLTILFGALFRNSIPFNFRILFAILSASLIAAAGYVINDFFDRQIDRVNRPQRMIPSGQISPKAAYLYAILLFITGIILSYFTINIFCILLAFANSVILYLYAKKFKKTLIIGNLIVSYSAASCFIYGGLSAGNLTNIIPIALFAFLFTLIREIVKDAEDITGDQKFSVNSIAIKLGKKAALVISLILSLGITLLFGYLKYLNYLSLTTFILSLLLITLPLTLILIYLYSNIDSKAAFSKSSSLLKLDMLVLLIIFLIGN
jgi:geranylgeranylglycerol-phosphate geranylgeranyltransferase